MKTVAERQAQLERIDRWLSAHPWESWVVAVIFAEIVLLAASVLAHLIPQ